MISLRAKTLEARKVSVSEAIALDIIADYLDNAVPLNVEIADLKSKLAYADAFRKKVDEITTLAVKSLLPSSVGQALANEVSLSGRFHPSKLMKSPNIRADELSLEPLPVHPLAPRVKAALPPGACALGCQCLACRVRANA